MFSKIHIIILLCFVFLITLACKKNAGRHCPLIEAPLSKKADLGPVFNVKPIMDTLAKYQSLLPYKVYYNVSKYDASMFTALVKCQLLYKNLTVFRKDYSLYFTNNSSDTNKVHAEGVPELAISNLSLEPSISRNKAENIARDKIDFETCVQISLGIMVYGTDKVPEYFLVWKVDGVEYGYPSVILDAQNGMVYEIATGIFID